MSLTEFISRGYTVELQAPADFPLCVCGGEFKIQDVYNKARFALMSDRMREKAHYATIADCKVCREHFIGYGIKDIREAVIKGQFVRANKKGTK